MDEAEKYDRHIECCRSYVKSFLALFVKLRQNKKDGIVMDLGCGPGRRILHQILPIFSESQRIVCIDVSPSMVDYARKTHSHPRIQHHVADIENWKTLAQWEGCVSQAVSVYVFYWLQDQERGFGNLFRLLQPGGEAAILTALSAPFWDAIYELGNNSKWRHHVKDISFGIPESHFKNHGAEHFKEMLLKVGLEVLFCETLETVHEFSSVEDCKGFYSSVCALVSHIPEEQREEFREDLVQGVARHVGTDSKGIPFYKCTAIQIIVRKPLMKNELEKCDDCIL